MRIVILITILMMACSPVVAQDSVWAEIYKPIADDFSDNLYGGCLTSDGNYVFAGYTTSFQIWVGDCYLMKIDTNGDTIWTGTYGSPYRDYGHDVIETYDNNLAAVGFGRVINDSEEYRVRLYKTASTGGLMWEKSYFNVNGCNTYGVTETSDYGFAIVGYTGPYGNYDMYIMRADSIGDSLWLVTYGGSGNDKAYDVAATDDKGYIVVGETESFGEGSSDIYIIGVDSLSEISWARTYGDTLFDAAMAVEKASDGSFLVVGQKSYVDPIESRMYLIKIDQNGDTAWTTSIYNGSNSAGYAVCESNDGGYIMVGVASYGHPKDEDVYIAKVDQYGDSVWAVHYGGDAYDIGRFVHQATDGYIYIGATFGESGYGDFYALKLYEIIAGVEIMDDPAIPGAFSLKQNSPNPFNATTEIEYFIPRTAHVELTVYNTLGQKVKTLVDKTLTIGDHITYWNGTDEKGDEVASGTYLYSLKMDGLTQSKKMILLK